MCGTPGWIPGCSTHTGSLLKGTHRAHAPPGIVWDCRYKEAWLEEWRKTAAREKKTKHQNKQIPSVIFCAHQNMGCVAHAVTESLFAAPVSSPSPNFPNPGCGTRAESHPKSCFSHEKEMNHWCLSASRCCREEQMLLELCVGCLCQWCFLPLSARASSMDFPRCVFGPKGGLWGGNLPLGWCWWTVFQSGGNLRSQREDPIVGISFRAKKFGPATFQEGRGHMCVFRARSLAQVARRSGGASSLEVLQAWLGGAWSNLEGIHGRGE